MKIITTNNITPVSEDTKEIFFKKLKLEHKEKFSKCLLELKQCTFMYHQNEDQLSYEKRNREIDILYEKYKNLVITKYR